MYSEPPYEDYEPYEEAVGQFTELNEKESPLDLKKMGKSPRLLLFGSRGAGKTSIQRVVFSKLSPHETGFIDPSSSITQLEVSTSPLSRFFVVDTHGDFDFVDVNIDFSPSDLFQGRCAFVFVLDSQKDDTAASSVEYFVQMAKLAFKANPKTTFDVIIHKVDGDAYLSDDHKRDCQNEIKNSIAAELKESGLDIRVRFHMTSVYDHSVLEAFSRITQELLPQRASLEKLLDSLVVNCEMDKAFLFDTVSKIYVATDYKPVDAQTCELCSDMIDIVVDIASIYGNENMITDGSGGSDDGERKKSSGSIDIPNTQNGQDDDVSDSSNGNSGGLGSDATSVIQLTSRYTLYFRQIDNFLALVCLMHNNAFARSGIIEYNVRTFKHGIQEVIRASKLSS